MPQNLRFLWRHLPTELRNVYCVVKHIQSHNRRRKERPNPCIIGDAILPETGMKLTNKCGSEFGGLLWRHLTPDRTRSSADADNGLDAFSGQSRSTNMVPFWVHCDFSLSM